ncbi:MAG: response regulator [Chitinivibrionales bacterium]|nr:response regulator [Chitinivibrionales bacterium]
MKQNSDSIKKGNSKILIVDDHPVVRQGLAQLINQSPGLAVCAEAENALDAMGHIEKYKPDLVVLDLSLGKSSGLTLLTSLKSRFSRLHVLVLSVHDESIYAERVLRQGAKGYIMKKAASETVIEAIHKVLSGDIYLSSEMKDKLIHKMIGAGTVNDRTPIDTLTNREIEVYQFVGQGMPTREIADKLHLSVKTVETYLARIKDKLHIANSRELIMHAMQWVQKTNP